MGELRIRHTRVASTIIESSDNYWEPAVIMEPAVLCNAQMEGDQKGIRRFKRDIYSAQLIHFTVQKLTQHCLSGYNSMKK